MRPIRRLVVSGVLALLLCSSARLWSAEPAKLTVQSEPPGATVALDGKPLDIRTPVRLNVPPGTHSLSLSKQGYETVTRELTVSGDALANFNLPPSKSAPPKPEPGPRAIPPANPPANPPAPSRAAGFQPASPPPVTLTGPVRVETRGPKPPKTKPAAATPDHVNFISDDNPLAGLLKVFTNDDAPAPAAADTATPPVNKDDIFPLLLKENPAPAPAPAEGVELAANDAASPPAPTTAAEQATPAPAAEAAPAAEPAPPRTSTCLLGDTLVEVGTEGPLGCAPAPQEAWPDSIEHLMSAAIADLPHFPERFNVLLLGLDRRDARGSLATGAPYTDEELKNKAANSDVIMIIQLDLIARQVRIVSIPRDTKVKYAGRGGSGKINAAYAYGREDLARRTVESFLNVKIHRTVVADWRAAKKCITLFKGLGLDYNGFSEQELFWHLRKRTFARGDFRRIERQQRFLQYAGIEYLRLNNETRESQGAVNAVTQIALDLAVKQGLGAVQTDLSYDEIQLLAYTFRDYNLREMTMAQVSGSGGLEGGGEDTGGIYFFNPSPKHSFDEIIAKVEKQVREDRSQ